VIRNMIKAGNALSVPGNHDVKLMRKLRGKNVRITHGLHESLAEFDALPSEERNALSEEVSELIYTLVSHYPRQIPQLTASL